MKRVLALLLLAACSGSSSPTTTTTAAPTTTTTTTTAPLPRGVSHDAIEVGGRERTYRLFVPDELPPGAVPLLLGFHGGTGWADQFAGRNRVEALAGEQGFLVVHPDGILIGDGPGAVWNGGMCCGPAVRQGVDDVAFVAALLDRLVEELPVDVDRVYAFGHSNGGIMSYRLGCELADRIAGIGVMAGTLGVDECAPSAPVALLHLHGTADENLPYEGGRGPRSIAGVDFPPPLEGFARFADAVGCAADAVEVAEGDLTLVTRQPCDGGVEATFVTMHGASHVWPDDAGGRIVEFFLSQRRRAR